MAKPQKIGLDYFPFDVTLLTDRKFRKVKMKYGFVAVGVYISLLSLIYQDKGYYLDYSSKDDIIWNILEILQGKFQPSAETVEQVIDDLVASGLFSLDHFKSKIITSKRIQATYYAATVRSVTVQVDTSIWMLSIKEMQEISTSSKLLKNFLNVTDTHETATDTPENATNTTLNENKLNENNRKIIKELNNNNYANSSQIFSIDKIEDKLFNKDNPNAFTVYKVSSLYEFWRKYVGYITDACNDEKPCQLANQDFAVNKDFFIAWVDQVKTEQIFNIFEQCYKHNNNIKQSDEYYLRAIIVKENIELAKKHKYIFT